MENLVVKLEMTVAQINTVLKHLGVGAYAEVSDLISHIHSQATPQVQAANNSAPAASDSPPNQSE